MKRLEWLGSSRSDIKAFEVDARREAGHQLLLVQLGLEPTDWKPMPNVALGVNEIRITNGRQIEFCTWRNLQTRFMFCTAL